MQFVKKQHIFIGTLMFSVVLSLIPLTTSAQTVNMPDANLRNVINEALGNAPNARITAASVRTLRELRAGNRKIKDLTGIEAATNLEFLYLYDNSISDLSPLKKLIKLSDLNIGANNISDISPLSELVNLAYLNLGVNDISDLSPVAGLINLRGISVEQNLIVDLSPLKGLIELEWIGAGELPIADLTPLSGLINLQTYHSWGSPIKNLEALKGLPRLREINICGGELSDISALGEITGLQDLYLVGNDISDLSALANLKRLTRLNLTHNKVSDLSPLERLDSLRWIDLRDNAVSDVAPLAAVNQLEWIDLTENTRITDVSSLATLPHLTWLGLAGNTGINRTQLERFSGNTTILHSDFTNSTFPEAGPKITGPWLWTIVPGAGVSDADLLAKVTQGAATEVKVATFGATEGKPVGSSKWLAHDLAPIGSDNINEMTDALGWGSGSAVYNHVVYGTLTLESPRKQQTTMLVGSNDGVKVWLNGEVVHYNPTARGAADYQDAFPVTLKRGSNVLLVAIDNRGKGPFSGFFGFAKNTDYQVNPIGKQITVSVPAWDVNKDGITDIFDLILVGQDFGKARAANNRTDVNRDGKRDIKDLVLVANHLDELSGVPAAPPPLTIRGTTLDTATLRAWIAAARMENDGSLTFQQGIANLQQLLALLAPEKTALLANYPNPFNPETWIPYQLAEPAPVTLRVYTTNGALVRILDLGHQAAGTYQTKQRAAYWDGKNDLGESVASGVYFYTLTAGDFMATRKMLIVK